MALKKPSELFGKKGDNSKISENINGNLNNIKQQFDKVEELKKQLEGVTSSIDNSLSEVVDNSINFVEFKEEYSEEIDKLNTKIQSIKEDFDDKIDELRAAHLTLNTEITILDKRQNSLHIRGLKDEVLEELQNILNGNVYQNIRSLEEKFDSINEKQLQNLQEGLLNEPPNVDNSDPLTPLDKKYVTLDEFQEQYKLFINRIQKQLATFGGGGAVRIQDLDDVDISTAKVNNKFLKYNSTSGKWEGADASGGGGGGNTGIDTTGLSTFNKVSIGGTSLTSSTIFANGSPYGVDIETGSLNVGGTGNIYVNDTLWFADNNRSMEYYSGDITSATGAKDHVFIVSRDDTAPDSFRINQAGAVATGVMTATSFSGSAVGLTSVPSSSLTGALPALDGSALTNVVGSGSGVVVQHDGSSVGTAGTINFSTNLDVTAIHAGIVTVTATGGGSGIAGINTVGISSFNNIGVGGSITFRNSDAFIHDFAQFGLEIVDRGTIGIQYFGKGHFFFNDTGTETHAAFLENAQCLLHFNGTRRFETNNTGAVVLGVCSATSFTGNGANITGISTLNITNYGVGLGGGGGGSGISNVVEDTTPELGGNLNVNGNDIVSTSNGDIDFTPNGTGAVVFKGVSGNGGNGAGRFKLNCEVNSHGITIQGPPHSAGANYTLTLPNNIVNGQFLKTDASGNLSWAASGTSSRTTTNASTGSIAQTASANITIPTPGKTFSLLKVAISAPAYVILYTDSTSRSNDASRSEGTDPTPGSGVLTEVSTTTSGASTFLMTPAVLGWNNDSTPANQIYAKVVNKRATSGSNAITVTLTSVALES